MNSLRVLLVEASEARAAVLKAILVAAGHTVFHVFWLAEAPEALAIEKFDAVLLGSAHGATEVFELSRFLRNFGANDGLGSEIALLALAGDGASPSFATVPGLVTISETALGSELSEHLSQNKPTPARFDIGRAELVAEADRMPPFEPAAFENQCVSDPELMVEVIDLFLNEYQSDLAAVTEAFSAESFDQLARAAHKIKGTLGCLHATRAWHRTESLENAAKQGNAASCAEMLELLEADLAGLDAVLQSFREQCLCR